MKRKPFFTGYRPQFYFRDEKCDSALGLARIMANRAIKAACNKAQVEEGDNQ